MLPALALAQVPPRFYWKTLMGSNGVPVIYQSLSGNANPLDPAHVVSADVGFEADVAIAGYAKMLPLFNRPAMVALLAPMGRVSGGGTIAGNALNQSASGFGDPMLEFNINLVGAKPIMNIPDLLRYEPKISLDLILDVAFPIGEYHNDQAVNIGQNRWFGRICAPIVWQLGPWVPGRRTTFELLPSVWFFGDNDDYLEGQRLETKPMFQVEGHLTRDFTEHFWASLDGVWVTGGESSINGQAGSSLNNIGVGYTFGYQMNDNIQLTLGYAATVNDSDPEDLKMNGFSISFVYGWHKLVEGIKRLEGGE
jgi:hypothetical protein